MVDLRRSGHFRDADLVNGANALRALAINKLKRERRWRRATCELIQRADVILENSAASVPPCAPAIDRGGSIVIHVRFPSFWGLDPISLPQETNPVKRRHTAKPLISYSKINRGTMEDQP